MNQNPVPDLSTAEAAADFFACFDTSEWGPWCKPFLISLSNHGIPTAAAAAAGVSRVWAHRYRHRNRPFSDAWDEALEMAWDRLEHEAMRRALQGVEKPFLHRGKVVHTVREFSDDLLKFMLRAKRAEQFRERVEQKVVTGDSVQAPKLTLILQHPDPPAIDPGEKND